MEDRVGCYVIDVVVVYSSFLSMDYASGTLRSSLGLDNRGHTRLRHMLLRCGSGPGGGGTTRFLVQGVG